MVVVGMDRRGTEIIKMSINNKNINIGHRCQVLDRSTGVIDLFHCLIIHILPTSP